MPRRSQPAERHHDDHQDDEDAAPAGGWQHLTQDVLQLVMAIVCGEKRSNPPGVKDTPLGAVRLSCKAWREAVDCAITALALAGAPPAPRFLAACTSLSRLSLAGGAAPCGNGPAAACTALLQQLAALPSLRELELCWQGDGCLEALGGLAQLTLLKVRRGRRLAPPLTPSTPPCWRGAVGAPLAALGWLRCASTPTAPALAPDPPHPAPHTPTPPTPPPQVNRELGSSPSDGGGGGARPCPEAAIPAGTAALAQLRELHLRNVSPDYAALAGCRALAHLELEGQAVSSSSAAWRTTNTLSGGWAGVCVCVCGGGGGKARPQAACWRRRGLGQGARLAVSPRSAALPCQPLLHCTQRTAPPARGPRRGAARSAPLPARPARPPAPSPLQASARRWAAA
jgi:hypothetical protein